ncbi:MAG TPA: GWxTD domain-containing protein [Terracidiphilus sp.]|nr:GWxTD domain-containing protein [Terracidiphilus sp.]
MTAIAQLSKLPLVHALGWALLHFCWQGALIALLLACVLAVIPERLSQLRYAVCCAAMALMIALPLITFGALAERMPASKQHVDFGIAGQAAAPALNAAAYSSTEPWTVWCEDALNQALPTLIGFWLAGVIVLLIRLNLGLIATRRIRTDGVEPAPAELEKPLRSLRVRLGMERTIELFHSARVHTPTVIGWLKPAILFPAGCVAGLSAAQVEAILAHELAHIRRHDYLVNLFQSVVETVLFYHPAVWWVSGRIRREREHCCDDLAVSVTGDRLAYARALSLLEEMRAPSPSGAVAATGGVLKMRIARLLGVDQPPAFPRSAAVTLLVVAGTVAGLAALGVARAQSAPGQKAAPTEQITGKNAAMYRQWLDQDVRWIITPREKQVFLRLRDGQERNEFIRQFWERRNPDPGSPVNKYKQEHYRRVAYANRHFGETGEPGWETDRGHVYVVFGPPDSIDAHPSADNSSKPFELWHYRSVQIEVPAVKNRSGSGYGAPNAVVRKDVDFRFVDECACGRYELKSPWPSAQAGAETNEPPSAADVRVQVRTLNFISNDLPKSTEMQIARSLQGKTYSLQVLSELVRVQLRNRGYVEARAEIQNLENLLASPSTPPVDISVRVSAGAQYTLGGIVVEGAQAFSTNEIVQQFPIHPGDLFTGTEIAKGLDALKKLYASKGYVHFGAIPSLQMDQKQHTVTLNLRIIEGKSQDRNPASGAAS